MSLPPLNFTPREAAAVAVALSRSEHVLFARDARSALQKIVAAMPERALEEAHATAEKVRLLVQPTPEPDAEIAETIWRAVRDGQVLRIGYIDVGGLETEREVEPQHVVVGPNGLLPHRLVPPARRRPGVPHGSDHPSRADAVAAAPAARRSGAGRRWPRDEAARVGAAPRKSSPDRTPTQGCRETPRRWAQPATPAGEPTRRRHAMTNPAPGTLAWFEVATGDPDSAEKFYGSLFDWTLRSRGPAASGGMDYRNIKASGADGPMGGVFGTGGQVPDHAVFYILVADVEATCVDAEQLGGSVVSKHLDPGPGAPTFAYLRDPSGNQFGVFTPTGGLMAPDARETSPSELSDGDRPDGARDLYDELTDDLLYDPAIGRATMMGYPCVRLAGKFLASYDDKAGCLVVKLSRERVAELIEDGRRRAVRPRRQDLPRVGVDPHRRPGPVADSCSPKPSTSHGKGCAG